MKFKFNGLLRDIKNNELAFTYFSDMCPRIGEKIKISAFDDFKVIDVIHRPDAKEIDIIVERI